MGDVRNMQPDRWLGVAAVITMFVAYAVYIVQALRKGGVRPHPGSWLFWAFTTLVAYLAQVSHGGAAGSWVTGLTAGWCFAIAAVGLFKFKWRTIGPADYLPSVAGAGILILYCKAVDPTTAVILATGADLVGYAPTLRQAWLYPGDDSATAFALNSLKFVFSLLALAEFSVVTVLFPAALVVANGTVALILLRRRSSVRADLAAPLAPQ